MLTVTIKHTKITLFAMCMLIFLSCASSPQKQITGVTTEKDAPIWLSDTTKAFPESDYLAAVGYAADRETSSAMAKSNLIKILKQRVEAITQVNQTYKNNLTEQDRTIDTTVKTSSLIDEIMGLKIQETWVANDNTIYSLALLQKKETINYYKQLIMENEATINDYLSIVAENPVSFTGISACANALNIAYENDSCLEIISVLDYNTYEGITLDYESSSAIKVLMEKQNNLIYIGITVGGDSSNRLSTAFATSLNNMGFTAKDVSESKNSTDIPYTLDVTLVFETLPKSEKSQNITVYFTLEANLKDSTGKIILPWSYIGKEAHVTESQAKQRAIYTIERLIENEYPKVLQKLNR